MPVINTYDKPASQIKVGNYLFGQKVMKVTPKRVSTTVILSEPVDFKNEWTFKLTDMLEVGVEERTAEEFAAKAAEDLAFRKDLFVKEVAKYARDASKGMARADAQIAERREKGWNALDYSSIQTYLEGAATADLGKLLASELNWRPLDEAELATFDLYEHTVKVVMGYVNALMRHAMNLRTLSRSTSVVSNLCDDMKMQAIADFLNDLRYNVNKLPGLEGFPTRY